MHIDTIWHNARLLRMTSQSDNGVIERGAIACREGRICYVGAESDASRAFDAPRRIDCSGRWITPGLIDCHTHLVYEGNRAAEFEQRLAGASYEQIARAGGGILSTVRATRAATIEQLISASLPRLDALIAEGVTTVEIKSGYGLSWPAERLQLEAARELGRRRPVEVMTTFLGAHAVPPEFAADAESYIDAVIEMMSIVAREDLAQAVDAFCEHIGFSAAQTARVFEAAHELGLGVKLHADQLSDSGGAELAARFDALSADHLEYSNEAGIQALAKANTVAVLLPGAFYFLREPRSPPISLLRQYRVPIALATDCNPGTSPLTSVLLAMNMGATLFGLTVNECLEGVTREAARALGRADDLGTLEVGKWCDLAIWDVERPAELVYNLGLNPLHTRVWRGQ